MVNHIRISRFVFSLFLSSSLLISLLWLGSHWVGASGTQADQKSASGNDFASFERYKRGIGTETDKRYEAARERVCRMPHSNAPLTRGGAWENLGPDATAGKDLCGEGNRAPLQADGEGARYTVGAVSPDGRILIGGTTNRGLLRRDASGAWSSVAEGAVFTAFNRDLEGVLYASPRGMQLRRSLDNGASFAEAANGIEGEGLPIAPFALDPNESQRLWTGGQALWRTNDGATQWVKAGDTIAGSIHARISALAISPQNSNFVLAGTSEGFIHHHAQALLTGADTKWPATRPRAGFVSSLTFDPHNPSLAYATYSSFGGAHVWRTTDAGATWQPIDGNGEATLPDIPVHSLAIDPDNSYRLLIGTDFGIFFTIDGGASWTWENAGPGGAVVESLALHRGSEGTRCFAFTRGAGVWRINLSEAGAETAAESQQQQCTFSVGRELISFGAGGGSGNLNVTASASNCAWTATIAEDSQAWLRISSGSSGTGNGTLIYQVQANPATSARKGTMTVAGKTVTIEQSGTGGQCTTTTITSGQTVSGRLESGGCFSRVRSGGTYYAKRYSFTGNFNGPIAVTAAAGFGAHLSLFTSTSDTPLAQDEAAKGANARIPSAGGYFVAPVTTTYVLEVSSVQPMRAGDFTLSLFAGPSGCPDVQFSETTLSFNAATNNGSVIVNAIPGCLWNATTTANWISFPTGSQGIGTQSLSFRLAQNTAQDSRRATITIGGRSLSVEQGGAFGTCAVQPLSVGGSAAGSLLTGSDCLSRTKTAAPGGGPIVADRYTFTARAGQELALIGYSRDYVPYLVLTDANGAILSEATLRLPANNRSFIVPADGTYYIEVTSFGYDAVSGSYALRIEETPAGCNYQLSPSRQLFDNEGGAGTISVKAPAGCAWSATSSDSSRVTFPSTRNGAGDGSIRFEVSRGTLLQFNAGIFIGGQLFSIEQAGSNSTCVPRALTPGQTVRGTLNLGDCQSRFRTGANRFASDRYSFSAKAGQRAFVVSTGNSTPFSYFYLYTPEGNVIGSGAGLIPSLTIPADGEYFLEITSQQPLNLFDYSFKLNLNAAACEFGLSASPLLFDGTEGLGTLNVATSSDCAWSITTTASWIALESNNGAGSSAISFQISPNPTTTARRAVISLGNQSLTIEQAGTAGNCITRTIASGQTVAGRLEPADCRSQFGLNAVADRFTFAGKAGEQVLISALTTIGSRAFPNYQITLADQTGKRLATGVNSLPSGSGYFTLPATGTYLFEVASTFTTSIADYAVALSLTQPSCSYAVTATQTQFETAGGTGRFNVVAPPGCAWQTRIDSPWVKIDPANATGSGTGTISFTIDPNPSSLLRAAIVQIADQRWTISQAGRNGTCATLTIPPNQRIAGSISNADCNRSKRYLFDGKAGEQVALQIDSISAVPPSMTLVDPNGVPLLTTFQTFSVPSVALPASGFVTLPSTGKYSLDVFPSLSGTFDVTYGLTLLQTEPNCNFDILPLGQRFNALGDTGSIGVFSASGCVWTARSSATWISIRSAVTGTGNGTLDFAVAPNPASLSRRGTINIAGREFSIEQAGTGGTCEIKSIEPGQTITGGLTNADCTLPRSQSLSPADLFSFSYKTGRQLVLTLKPTGFAPIVTLTDSFGNVLLTSAATTTGQEIRLPAQGALSLPADGTYIIQVAANSGFFSTASYALSLVEPTDCLVSVLPLKANPVESAGGAVVFNVQAGAACAWNAASNANWITVTSGARGTGAGEVRLAVNRNTSNTSRTGTVTIAGTAMTIEQAGFGGSCRVRAIEPGQALDGTLTSGDCVLPGSFSNSGNYDLFSFPARGGEKVHVVLDAKTFSMTLAVLNANGESLSSLSAGSSNGQEIGGPVAIPADGTYFIRLSGAGDYTVRLLKSPARCNLLLNPARIESPREGGKTNLQIVTGQDCAWSIVPRNDWITVAPNSRNGVGPATVEVTISPNLSEQRLRRGSIRINNLSLSTEQAGTLSNCETASIAYDQAVRGTYTNGSCGEKKRYTFTGRTGDRIALQIVGFDTERWSLDLLDPQGISLYSSIEAARWPGGTGYYTLQKNGVYTLLVGEPVSSGGYRSRDYVLSLATPQCNTMLSSTRQGFDSEGGAGSIALSSTGNCPWTAESNADWVRILSGTQGAGTGRVEFTVEPNPSVNRRTASLVIAGRVVLIEQAGVAGSCTPRPILSGEPVSGSWSNSDCRAQIRGRNFAGDLYTFEGKAGQRLLLTTTIAFSNFSASSSMALLGPDGELLAQYAPPGTNEERFARLPQEGFFVLPADGTYTIESAPGYETLTGDYELSLTLISPGCSYAVSFVQERFDAASATSSIIVSATEACSWEALSPVSWVRIDSNKKSTGSGTVNFTVEANAASVARSTVLLIAGTPVRVEQAGQGGSCKPGSIRVGQNVQGQITFSDCRATNSTSNLADRYAFSASLGDQFALELSQSSNVGMRIFAPNGNELANSSGSRLPTDGSFLIAPATGTYLVEVYGSSSFSQAYTLRLLQSAAGCNYSISPLNRKFESTAGTGSLRVNVAGSCSWTASSDSTWLTLTGAAAGNGPATLNYAVAANTTSQMRRGRISAGSQSVLIEQAGTGGSCSIQPLTIGEVISGTISTADCLSTINRNRIVDRYSFTARAGDRFSVRANNSGSFYIALLAPTGQVIAQADFVPQLPASGALTLSLSGNYILEIGDSFSLNYQFTATLQPACSFALSPANLAFAASGGSGTLSVAGGTSCEWIAASNASWLTLNASNAQGSGNGTINLIAAPNPDARQRTASVRIGGQSVTVVQAGAMTMVSSASFGGTEFARESLVSGYGLNLATRTELPPIPRTTVAGTSVKVRDAGATIHDALISYASPGQINFLIPTATVPGPAFVLVTASDGTASSSEIMIADVAPSLFSANSDGKGVAAGFVLRIKADGTRSYEPIARYDEASKSFVAVPIDLGPEGDQVYLCLLGTGFRFRSGLAGVVAQLNGLDATVSYAGPVDGSPGTDQVNMLLPRARGVSSESILTLTVDGKKANSLKVLLR